MAGELHCVRCSGQLLAHIVIFFRLTKYTTPKPQPSPLVVDERLHFASSDNYH
jgi:hypothetical protein